MTVSIIIVNYNSGEFLINCLKSIFRNIQNFSYEVIVVDNNSSDNSFSKCKIEFSDKNNFIFIHSDENVGFAKANNIGARIANGEILHFLNPDTKVFDDMESSYKIVESAPEYIYINRLKNPDGTIINNGYLMPTLKTYFKRIFSKKAPKWYLGASIIISKINFVKIGMWNEQFFMYSEDLDFFYKAQKHNLQVEVLPSIIFHAGGGCSKNVWSNKKRERIIDKSFKKFYYLNGIYWQYPLIKVLQGFYKIFN